jgi:SAM-dependent methyltransferase
MAADFPAKVAMVRAKCGPEPTCRILDVGCGKGFFVKACVDAGMDAEGVDLSPSGIAFGKEQLGLRLHQGHLGALKSALGQFDVVTFWATIEHLPDPVAMMRDIADVLKPGGRLLLDTGIGDDWLERLLPGVTQWYDPPEHLFVLTEEGMKIALEKAGLHLESFSPNFERSGARRMIKTVRNGALAAGLRTIAELGGAMQREVTFMRFPLGNLMSATATKPT